MSIYRPADGFEISWPDTVQALIDAEKANNPEFARYWDDLLERLKLTAHIDGWPDERLGKGCRMFVAQRIPELNRPRLALVYRVRGDHVRIRLLRIGN